MSRVPLKPTTPPPPPPRNRNEASLPRGRPCGLRGSRLLRGERPGPAAHSGITDPHNLVPPAAAAAGALSLRPESRRPAEARPGPELPFPPAGAARAPPPCPFLRPPDGPPTTGLATDPGHPSGSAAPASRQVMDPRGNSARCLQPPPRARARSGRRHLLPALPLPLPEKAPKKPPHFPSRPRRRSAGRPFGQERPLEGERPARPASRAPRAGGGGATASRRARGCRPPEPARLGLWPAPTCRSRRVCALGGPFVPRLCPPPQSGEQILRGGGEMEPPQGRGRRTSRPHGAACRPGKFGGLRAPRVSRGRLGRFLAFSPTPSLVSLPLVFRVFLEDAWEAGALVLNPPVSGAPWLGSGLLGSPSLEHWSPVRVASGPAHVSLKAGGEELSGTR